MQINLAKTPQENILDLVRDANAGLQLTAAQVTIGAGAALDGDATYDSQVTLTAVPNAGFSGTKRIRYNRLRLDQGTASTVASVQVTDTDTEATVATKVAAAYGLKEGEFTTSDLVAPVNEDTNGSVVITPVDGSLLYNGAPVTVTLTIADADVPLETAIANDGMNGFDQPTAQG